MAKLFYHNGKENILIEEMMATGPVDIYRFFELYGENEIMEKVCELPNYNGCMIGCLGLFTIELD